MFQYLPTKAKLVFEDKKNNIAVFEIDKLYRGWGTTLGNALRRVLLSSLAGAAITAVKIKGVSHEFSTIPGVKEDVVEIMLNLKRIRLRIIGKEEEKLFLKVKGKGEVKAGDIKKNANVKIINPEEKIATITDNKTTLEMELTVQKGIGYEPVEQRKTTKVPIGTILLDAIYSPIKKVGYEVEDVRVGKRTDFNKLRLSIQTDGSISPTEALLEASELLLEHFSLIKESFKEGKK